MSDEMGGWTMRSQTFLLATPATVDLAVKMNPPGQRSGEITLTVRYLRVSERRALIERLQDENETLTDEALADELVTGWRGLADAQGAEIPYEGAALHDCMDIPYFARGVTDALIEHLFGARAKNFVPSVEDGPAAKPE